MKTYLHLAEKDSIRFDWPYGEYQMPKVAGQWVAAQPYEIELLDTFYQSLPVGSQRRCYLRRCEPTGLRLSDQRAARRDWLFERALVFLMHKGRRKDKLMKLPLGQRAIALVEDAIRERDGEEERLFINATGQKSNDVMEAIRPELSIKSKLHNHVGRESFATLYLENGAAWNYSRRVPGPLFYRNDDEVRACLRCSQAPRPGHSGRHLWRPATQPAP